MSFVNVIMSGEFILIASDGMISNENEKSKNGFKKFFKLQSDPSTIWAGGTGSLFLHQDIKRRLLEGAKKTDNIKIDTIDQFFKALYQNNKAVFDKFNTTYFVCGTDHEEAFCYLYTMGMNKNLQCRQYHLSKSQDDQLVFVVAPPTDIDAKESDYENEFKRLADGKKMTDFGGIQVAQRKLFSIVSKQSKYVNDEYFFKRINV